MPTQPTAIVSGARLTASERLTNWRGSRPSAKRPQRDSLEANGALLALTGLMLEKESELSGTVVGRPAGRQGQGEQSPMAAAEMERRIGLMGRLNDAAARLRPQPEPEVADNDAELWYAACFACTTSLQKVVQSILDTYPMGFPAAAAQQQVDRVIGALLAMGPEAEALSDLLLPYPLVMSDLADAGLHDVAGDRFGEFVATLQEQDLRHGAMLDVLAADEPDVSEYLLRDADFDTEFATLRQARAIITTARRQGLDSVKLSKLAAAMGHEAEELGVTPPSTDYTTVNILLGEARAAGLPHEAIDRIYQAIDPDGYEEQRYEQAVDLLEFGDAAADGALDGLPHFDGEFSR